MTKTELALRAEIAHLRAALDHILIGVNHIALYKTKHWPVHNTHHADALKKLGPGREYDMWCCWNAAMIVRDALERKP